MTVQSRNERRFDRSSPVARYWLAQCEGFRVKGEVNGTVEKVVGSVAEQSAESLVVRTAWRRHHVPVDAVDAVVPAARLIVVDDPSREVAPKRHRTRSLADASSRAAGAVAANVADKAPPVARFVRDAAMMFALIVAAGIIMVLRAVGLVVVRVAQVATNTVAARSALRREFRQPR
jgi:hypothetical protein